MSELNRKQFDTMLRDGQCRLNTTARMVLMGFASHMTYDDDVQEAWPAKQTVATYAGMNRNTVTKYMDALIKDGWLVPSGKQHRIDKFNYTNGYRLAVGDGNEKFLLRREAWNKGNVASDADRSTSAMLTEATSDADRSKSGADSVGTNNHKSNIPPLSRDNNHAPAGAVALEGTNAGLGDTAKREDSVPKPGDEDVEVFSKFPEDTPNPPNEADLSKANTDESSDADTSSIAPDPKKFDYAAMADKLGFKKRYEACLTPVGVTPKQAFKAAQRMQDAPARRYRAVSN